MNKVLDALLAIIYCVLPQLCLVVVTNIKGRSSKDYMRLVRGLIGLVISFLVATTINYARTKQFLTLEDIYIKFPKKPLLSIPITIVMAFSLISENGLMVAVQLFKRKGFRGFVNNLPNIFIDFIKHSYITTIVAPIIEEIVFRGLSAKFCDTWWKMLLSSWMFFGCHVINLITSIIKSYHLGKKKMKESKKKVTVLPNGLKPIPLSNKPELDYKKMIFEILDKLYTLGFGMWSIFITRKTDSILCSILGHIICNIFGAPSVEELNYPFSFISAIIGFLLGCVWLVRGINENMTTGDSLFLTFMDVIAYAGVVYVEENTTILRIF